MVGVLLMTKTLQNMKTFSWQGYLYAEKITGNHQH
jgi:hypothetical protein